MNRCIDCVKYRIGQENCKAHRVQLHTEDCDDIKCDDFEKIKEDIIKDIIKSDYLELELQHENLKIEYSKLIKKLDFAECCNRADKHRVDNQYRLVRAFKDNLIKGVIDLDKETFIKHVIDYQFENSRGFGRG